MILPKTPFSKLNHIGLSINESALRLVEVNSNSDPIKTYEHHFPSPVLQGDQVDNPALISGLKQLIADAGTDQKYAAVGIPERYAYSRIHSLPPLPNHEIQEALTWQIEKIFPFSSKDIYMDWKILDQNQDTNQVLITVIPRPILDHLKYCLQAAGIFPIAFEPSASALSRLSNTDSPAQIILELNSHTTSATLVINGVSSLTTTTSFADRSRSGTVMEQITASVQGLLHYIQEHQLDPAQTQLIITGEKASAQLAGTFQTSLGISSQLLEVAQLQPQYHLAYSMARSHILPPLAQTTINLLPASMQQYYFSAINHDHAKTALKYTSIASLSGIIIAAITFMVVQLYISQAQATKTTLEANLDSPPPPGQFNLALINRQANRIVAQFNKKTSPEADISTIFKAIPPNITITKMNINAISHTYTISGIANNRQDLLNLKQALADTRSFTPINIPLSALEIETDITFTFNFQKVPSL